MCGGRRFKIYGKTLYFPLDLSVNLTVPKEVY